MKKPHQHDDRAWDIVFQDLSVSEINLSDEDVRSQLDCLNIDTTDAKKQGRDLLAEYRRRVHKSVNDWVKAFPVKEMRRLRFSLPPNMSDTESVLNFFGVSSPECWQLTWHENSMALRQTGVNNTKREAVAAWVREAEIIADKIPLSNYSESDLIASLSELRVLTRMQVPIALDRAQQICANVGVALVLVPELPGTRLSGCARWLSEKHALVGLTTRYRKDDQLWFTFFHEIGHILMHRARLNCVIDNAAEYIGDGIVDSDMEEVEKEADQFAADILVPPVALKGFLEVHRNTIDNRNIHEFAEQIGIGPGIVVGQLQHKGLLDWHQGNTLKQTIKWNFV